MKAARLEDENGDLLDGRVSQDYYQKSQFFDFLILALSLCGTILCYRSLQNSLLLYTNNCFTFVSCLLVCMREKILLKLKKLQGHCDHNDTLITSQKYKKILIEWMFLMIHPYSFLLGKKVTLYNRDLHTSVFYHYNDYLNLLSIMKNVYILKLLLQKSVWKSSKAQRICQMYGCEANSIFTIRAMIKKNPFRLILLMMLSCIIFFGHAIRICESPISRVSDEMDYFYITNSLWAVILTMTTVGYGDYYPRTDIGRFVMFCCCLVGVVIVSMMVVAVTNKLEMTNIEKKSFSFLNKLSLKKNVKKAAAKVIGKAARIYMNVKKDRPIRVSSVFRLSRQINQFKIERRKYESEKVFGSGQDIFQEFRNLNDKNKETNLFFSVIAKLIRSSKPGILDNMEHQDDKLIANLLIDLSRKGEMNLLKQRMILNDYVGTPNF